MKTPSISLMLFSLLAVNCSKKEIETYYFKAKVIQTSEISCYLPVLNFSDDSSQIRSLTGRNDINYTVLKLPPNFNIQNKKLYVTVATLKSNEEFPCNTLGVSYPHLKILDVKGR